jgi:hypothetical protein
MRIIFADSSSELNYGMVGKGQLYIDSDGNLCQKAVDEDGDNCSWKIADSDGKPLGEYDTCIEDDTTIKKILPIIKKFDFEG